MEPNQPATRRPAIQAWQITRANPRGWPSAFTVWNAPAVDGSLGFIQRHGRPIHVFEADYIVADADGPLAYHADEFARFFQPLRAARQLDA